MISSKSLLAWIATSALLAVLPACNEGAPAQPAPSREGDGTTAFSVTSTPQFNSNTQAVMDNVAGQSEAVQGAIESLKAANELLAMVSQLLAELQAEAPDPASYENPEDYQKAAAAHQAKVAQAQQQVEQAQKAVEQALAAVEKAQKELQKVQSSDLPLAQRKDAAEMERYLEAQKKELEAAAEQVASTTKDTDTGDGSADQSETKPTVKKTPVLSPFKGSTSTSTGLKAASDPQLSGGSTPSSSGLPTD